MYNSLLNKVNSQIDHLSAFEMDQMSRVEKHLVQKEISQKKKNFKTMIDAVKYHQGNDEDLKSKVREFLLSEFEDF